MKRLALLLALGLSLPCAVLAQTPDSSANAAPSGPPPAGSGHRGGALTDDERQELRQAREDAFKANPDLEAEGKDLMQKMADYQKKVREAMIAADPKVKDILDKMPQGRGFGRGFGGPGGGGPPPAPQTSTSSGGN